MTNLPRIMLSLEEICGYFSYLQQGFQESGYTADTSFVRKHPFAYKTEQKHSKIQKILLWNSTYLFSKNNIIFRIPFYVLYRFFLLPIFFIECFFKYDVFIFGFKKTFLPFFLDIIILKLFRKKTIFVFFGSDSRPAYLNGSLQGFSLSKIYKKTVITKKHLIKIGKYADHIIDAPAAGIFHERKIINWFSIGIPQKHDVASAPVSSCPLAVILHSPSNPKAKGTAIIREAIDELTKEGYKFQYVEMINRTNQQVLDSIKQADFVIDQLYSDTPMAVFATEAASYGKPAIVGGYEIDKIKSMLPPENYPPSYVVYPTKEAVKKAIITLLEDVDFRTKLGKQAQDFVHKNWNAVAVARRFLQIINDDIPENWYIYPEKMDFIYGCCLKNDDRKKIIKEYIGKYKKQSLCLSDKKSLEEKLLSSL